MRNHRLGEQQRIREALFDTTDTILHSYIRDNDIPKLRQKLRASTLEEVNEQNSAWGSPLHVAVLCDNLSAANLLLDAGADPLANNLGDGPSSPLMVAIRKGNSDIIHRLWASVSPRDHANGPLPAWSCLAHAATFGRTMVVRNLLDWWNGWSVEASDSALLAAAGRWHCYVVELLLSRFTYSTAILCQALHKAVNLKTIIYDDAHEAEYEGTHFLHQQQLVGLLVRAGANPNTLEFGAHLIIQSTKFTELVAGLKALLENGASPNAIGENEQTALHRLGFPVLDRMGHTPSPRLHETGIRLLLQHGASVTQPDAAGNTPLHCAAFGSDVHIFELYSSALACYEQETIFKETTNYHGETVLHWAAAGGKVGILQLLVERGAAGHVNTSTLNGWTPLMCALAPTGSARGTSAKNASDAIRAAVLLLRQGADPRISTAEGWTPLHCLALHSDDDLAGDAVRLAKDLVDHGVDIAARATMIVRDPTGDMQIPGHRGRPWGFRIGELVRQLASTQPDLIKRGRTALHCAAERGAAGVAAVLLQNGADPFALDAAGSNPKRLAAKSPWLGDRGDILQLLEKLFDEAET